MIQPFSDHPAFEIPEVSYYSLYTELAGKEGYFFGEINMYTEYVDENVYRIVNDLEAHYKSFTIPKRNGGMREIDAPYRHLRIVQEWILKNILYYIPASKYAKAYIPNLCIRDNARFHQGQKIVLTTDIEDFFNSIQSFHIWHIFKGVCEYDDRTATLLTNLCVYKGRLPQGAPTSPYLSNLVMRDFDQIMGDYCFSRGIRYTRYADDMTYSGDYFDIAALLFQLDHELSKKGLRRSAKKTRVLRQNTRQKTTGVVLNKKCQAPRSYRDKIRQEIHYIQTFGLESHLEKIGIKNTYASEQQYLQSLSGRIQHVLMINPTDKRMKSYKQFTDALLVLCRNQSKSRR